MANLPLYQNDSRWENDVLGFGSSETIGKLGCLLTCLAMVGNHFGGNETPASLNSKLKQNDGFQGPWVRAYKISSVFPNVNYQQRLKSDGQPAPIDTIDAALAAGSLPVVRVDYSPAAGIQSHWIILHKKQGEDYLIWDPYKSDKPNTLNGRFGFAGTPAEIIQEGILFGKGSLPALPTVETPAKTETPAPKPSGTAKRSSTQQTTLPADARSYTANVLVVEPTVVSLTLRKQPTIGSGNVLKYLARTDELLVLEEAETAKSKIGRRNEWLHVRDIEGNEGYVAAWYVTPDDDPAFGVQETAEEKPSPTQSVVIKTTSSSVSLRTEPRVSTTTLIKYLPFGTELKVVDAASTDNIGKQGKWLQVQMVDGRQGYIAAWYAARKA
jgi:hypothetical protein